MAEFYIEPKNVSNEGTIVLCSFVKGYIPKKHWGNLPVADHSLTQLTRFSNRNLVTVWSSTAIAFAYSFYFAVSTSSQLPLDLHSFRQSQTALGAYWLGDPSSWLRYELPILGFPWSIPFEFPTYQIMVHVIHASFGFPLIQTGRLLSYFFLIALIFPIRMLIQDLKLPKIVLPITCLLLLTSSYYLYWSRTFMIETTALFFTLFTIAMTVHFIQTPKLSFLFLAVLLGVIAGLTKSTTFLSFLVLAAFICIYFIFFKPSRPNKNLLLRTGIFIIPGITTLVSLIWVQHTDITKSLNPNGAALTSVALKAWNYGTFNDRLSHEFWVDLLFQRTILGNLGGGIGLLVLVMFFGIKSKLQLKGIVFLLVLMFLIPLFVFTNLHIVHWYYQVSSQIYLFCALAIILGHWIEHGSKRLSSLALVCVLCIAICNFFVFQNKFREFAEVKYSAQNSQVLAVADFVKRQTSKDDVILVYGQDWSSALAFAAERKTATLPSWMPTFEKSFTTPKILFNQKNPAAIIDCLSRADNLIHPTKAELEKVSKEIELSQSKYIKKCQIWYRE
jgi:hypothetical protein